MLSQGLLPKMAEHIQEYMIAEESNAGESAGAHLLLCLLIIVGAGLLFYWSMYVRIIEPKRAAEKIANTTPMDTQLTRFHKLFDGRSEVSMVRAETLLTEQQMEEIARHHGYTFARYFRLNSGEPKKIIFRRLNANGI